MALSKWLIATAMLGLSVSAAAACDDYEEEMAILAAKRAVAEAQAATAADPTRSVQAEAEANAIVTAEQTTATVGSADRVRQ